jgi:hypothetical protein
MYTKAEIESNCCISSDKFFSEAYNVLTEMYATSTPVLDHPLSGLQLVTLPPTKSDKQCGADKERNTGKKNFFCPD